MIAVTGVTGHLGRLIVEALLEEGVSHTQIVGLARTPEKAEDLKARGIAIRHGDYDAPDTLESSLAGVSKLLLVSSNTVGQRARQHEHVVNAAKKAGVSLLAYTSLLHADRSPMQLVAEHATTEKIIRDSSIPFIVLRNGWYMENYTDRLSQIMEHGVIMGCAGDGQVSAATRADYAAAAATVLINDKEHTNKVYELGGDKAFTMAELANEISSQSGRPVVYQNLPFDDYVQQLIVAGVPEPFAHITADSDRGIANGQLYTDSNKLSQLLGRPTTSMHDAVKAAVSKLL